MKESKQHKRWSEKDASLVIIFGDLFDKYLHRGEKPGYWQSLADLLGRTSMGCQVFYSRSLRRRGLVQVGEVKHGRRV